MTEISERLVRIETKVDMVLQQLLDHEGRLRTLEAWRWWVLGGAAAAGAAAGKVMGLIPG